MRSTAHPKGQRVITPEGSGEVIEIIGDNILVKLDSGQTKAFSFAEVEDDSSAG